MDVKSNVRELDKQCDQSSEKSKVATLARTIILSGLYAAVGYLTEGTILPFSARPFGIALLCAADRRVLFLYAGLCLSAWSAADRFLLIGIYTAILLFRLLARFLLDQPSAKDESVKNATPYSHLFTEHLALRVCTACVAALSLGLWRLFVGNFLFYDLYGVILSLTFCAISVLLMGGVFRTTEVGIYRYVGGVLTVAAIVILSLEGWQLYGISLATVGVMGITLGITRKYGVILGALSGTLLGLTLSVELSPAFAFAALAAGLLFSLSRFLGLAAAFSVATAWCAYIEGISILNGTLTGLLCATVLFSAIDRFFFSKPPNGVESVTTSAVVALPCEPLSPFAMDSVRLHHTNRTVKKLCESFSELSDTLFALSRRMQVPTAPDLRQICDKAFDASCASCSERNACWSERYHDTSAEIGSLCTLLRKHGRIEIPQAPSTLSDRCLRLPDIIDEINHRAAIHQKQLLQNDRTEIFAGDYRALSSLLAGAMVTDDGAFEPDRVLTDELCCAFNQAEKPLGVRQVAVFGVQRKYVRVLGDDPQLLSKNAEAIFSIVQKICPFPISQGIPGESGVASIDFPEAELFSVVCAQRSLCAEQETTYCGDTTGLFSTVDGRFCALISDGMGSGREAALTSGLCGVFLKKMIAAGSSCDMALDMLNGFLRNRGSNSLHECSATIDLLSLDLLHGKASFYKCGAAPTYIFRDGNLFKIRSHTVPLGIIAEPDTRKLELSVSAGDIVIMVSDGVTQSKEECPWLFDLLRSQGEQASPERLAELIVKYAKGEGCSDDVSVLIVKILASEQ